jgi:hypothetical protein
MLVCTLAMLKTARSGCCDGMLLHYAGLTGFIISFNPTLEGWNIDVDNWFWKIIRWTTYQSPIARTKGYDWYVDIFYVHIAIIMTILLAVVALTLALRKAEQSKRLQKMARWLQFFTDVVFGILYVSRPIHCPGSMHCSTRTAHNRNRSQKLTV